MTWSLNGPGANCQKSSHPASATDAGNTPTESTLTPLAEAGPPRSASLLRAELLRIAECCQAAADLAHRAAVAEETGGREAAEAERQEAAADFWKAGAELAHLCLLLIRHACDHQPDALRLYIVELLRPELEPIVKAIVRLESRR